MLKILIVEDDRELRQLFAHVLIKNGYRADGVSNGREALDAMEKDYYDLIISDIMMPVMDGYEATAAIRGLSNRPDALLIPIIAMTANAFAEDVQASLDAGMDGHLSKPIVIDEVVKAISGNISRQ